MRILVRTLKLLIGLEIGYLLIINAALSLPLTQSLINSIKPDKFSISWTRAWSLYPFRVHVMDLSLNGQARSQQWQLDTPEGSASISVLPLLLKQVNISDIDAVDVSYRQRPRPKAGKDYSSVREFFPPITGRELETNPPALPPRKTGHSWRIKLSNASVRGEHRIWLYQAQLQLQGTASVDLSLQTRGGPLAIDKGQLDLSTVSMSLNRDKQVLQNGQINGTLSLDPIVVRENKGSKALKFLDMDVNIQTQAQSLAFLNLYLQAFQGMEVTGSGELDGRLVLSQGKLLAPTDFNIDTDALALNLLKYHTEGNGTIRIDVPEETPETRFAISFSQLQTHYKQESIPMLTGDGLVISGSGSRSIMPVGEDRFEPKSLSLTIGELGVPDLQSYQRFLPDKWALKLRSGEGQLKGSLSVDQRRFDADLKLTSERAKLGIKDYQFNSSLDARTKMSSPDLSSGEFDLSGTYVKIDDAKIGTEDEQSKPWFAAINIDQGSMDFDLDKFVAGRAKGQTVIDALKEQEIENLLAEAHNDLRISGRISDLRWLNVMIDTPYDFAITGSGNINADLVLKSGSLATGARLELEPQLIGVDIMDYRAEGDGRVGFKVERGGETPDISLQLELKDGTFKRKQESQAFVENVHILLQAFSREVTLKKTGELNKQKPDVDLKLKILDATVKNMNVYNQYLPPASPLKFTQGQADLSADIQLHADDARGFVRLASRGLQARVDEQMVSGELEAQIELAGGNPAEMKFNIAGSSINLDKVRISGDTKSFRDDDWAAQIHLTRGNTLWRKPIQLDMEADIDMSDSIPLVAMMANNKGKETWLSKALIIDDVNGTVKMHVADEQIVIPYAYVRSDKIDVGAKAVLSRDFNDGILFTRYRKLHGIMKIHNGKRNIDILRARIKFDEYSPENVIQERNSQPPEAEATAPEATVPQEPNY